MRCQGFPAQLHAADMDSTGPLQGPPATQTGCVIGTIQGISDRLSASGPATKSHHCSEATSVRSLSRRCKAGHEFKAHHTGVSPDVPSLSNSADSSLPHHSTIPQMLPSPLFPLLNFFSLTLLRPSRKNSLPGRYGAGTA